MAGFSFHQTPLIDNIKIYLKQQGIEDQKILNGYCHALAILWSYKRLIGEQEQCFQLFKKIEQWNRIDDLSTDFEKLFSQISWLQLNFVGGSPLPNDSLERINILEPNTSQEKPTPPLQKEFVTSFTFTEEEIINLLKDVLKNAGKEVVIGSTNHSVSVSFENGLYKFFDSNGGVKEFKTVEEFVRHPEFGLIAAFVNENNRVAKILDTLNIKKIAPFLGLSIMVMDLYGKEVGNYPQNPIDTIIQARIRNGQKSGVDNTSWGNSTAVSLAADINDVNSLKVLIANKANINPISEDGHTPLSRAITQLAIASMKFLLDNGADLSIKYNYDGKLYNILEMGAARNLDADALTYLIAATIRDNQLEMLRKTLPDIILVGKIDINKPMADGRTLLQVAISSGHEQVVLELIKNGALVSIKDLDTANQNGHQNITNIIAGELLHRAIQHKDVELVRGLLVKYKNSKDYISVRSHETPLTTALKTGEDALAMHLLTEQNKQALSTEGEPPFITALKHGCLETMKKLMKEPHPTRDNENNNLLHIAAQAEQPAILAFLLKNGFEKFINTPNNHGLTPIETALRGNSWPVVKLLLTHEKSQTPDNSLGTTLLHWAAQGSAEVFENILSSFSDYVNQPDRFGRTPLCYAIADGNLANVKRLAALDNVCLGKTKQQNPINPLTLALERGNIEIAKFLLTTYGNTLVNLPNVDGKTPLHAVCVSRLSGREKLEFIQSLITKGASVDVLDLEGKLPLHYLAASSVSTDAAQALLHKSLDPIDQKDKHGMTPLHYAAQAENQAGNIEMVKFLTSKYASYDIQDNFGRTPVAIASKKAQEYFEFLQFCQAMQKFQVRTVEKHPHLATFLKMADYNGNTPLHQLIIHAAVRGLSTKENTPFTSMLQLLTKDPALIDINAKNKQGEAPLQIALKYGDIKTVEFLLQNKNINVFTQNDSGENVLHVVLKSPLIERDKLHLIKLVLEQGPALSHLKDKNKQTPLHRAVLLGNAKIVDLICDDANINARDIEGKTPLQLAIKKKNIELINLLIMRGANLNLADKSGLTPMQLATNELDKKLVEQMIAASKSHEQQTNLNNSQFKKVIEQIDTTFTPTDRLAVSLKRALDSVSKNQSEEQYKNGVIRTLEEKLTRLNPKKSDSKTFALFSMKNDPHREYRTKLTDLISQLKTTKALTI